MAQTSAKKVTPANNDEGLTDEDRATAAAATGASAEEISNAVTRAIKGDNAALWNILKRTDPKATKAFQRAGGFRGTQIDPAWRLQMMTEVFGPVGYGWGFEQVEWTIAERMIFICARVWISDPADRERKFYTGPQWGGTELVRKNRDGSERPDDESFKMSMTDAIGKCFLQLGLAADIYLGQFDDSKYREESETIFTAKAKGWDDVGIKRFEKEVGEKLKAIDDQEALADYWKETVAAKVKEIKSVNKDAHDRIFSAFSARKNAIVKSEEQAKEDKPADQDGVDMSDAIPAEAIEHEPQQEVPQKPVQADKPAAATEQRDHIDNALDELRRGDNGIPAPVAIKVMVDEGGEKNWRAYVDEAMAQLKAAYEDPEHGMAWLERWLELNRPTLDDLMVVSELGEKRVVAGYNKVKTLYAGLDVEAKAEADKHFPTLNVGHKKDGETVNWPGFVKNINNYLRDTPDNHRVAAQWWNRHKIQVTYLAKAGEIEKGVTGAQAAAEFTKALFARFPQIED